MTDRAKVLYADDEADVREVFNVVFSGDFEVTCVAGGAEALAAMAQDSYDVLVTDMRMDPMRGSELLARAYEQHRDTQRILLTGYSDHDDLASAVNLGHVFAYVQKPWDAEQLRLTILRAAEQRKLELENRRLVQELLAANARLKDDLESVVRAVPPRPRLQVTSPPMAKVFEQVVAVAGTDASVLLYGETGVGKELVASAVHERSARKRARFVAQNLAALPADLMASELFGHARGNFSGSQTGRRGLFELADGGTLFLDEISEAPPAIQAMLLRALESREIWPVGANEPRTVDLRIVAATNRDLLTEAKEGRFRLELYYRLAVAPIYIPPLRERPEDVRGLGAPMLEAAARRMGRMLPRLTDAAWAVLERHTWPGNVRELSNLMERIAIYHAGHEVESDELGLPTQVPGTSPWGDPRDVSVKLPAAAPSSVSAISTVARRGESSGRLPGDETTIVLRVPETGTTFDDIEREILVQMLAR
ncbi:MAG TPA: sigma-54 dependent transcriptional regulator, partial [Polyangiaceae bacterium]|nr:sigma-54 dependent transcriptional regulator [Polyangiaceae bacterium]